VATLPHPERTANIFTVKYSEDGRKLFVAGYPSGIVQVFDVDSRKEVRRIETPKGYRGSGEYAQMTADWKTIYVTDENKRKVIPMQTAGKKDHRIEYSGQTLAWDLTSGKALDPLPPEKEHGAGYARISPDGNLLVLVENASYLVSQQDDIQTRRTFVWDLKTRTKRKLGDGFLVPTFLPDGKTGALVRSDRVKKTSMIQRMDLISGKVSATRDTPDKELSFAISDVSADGKLAAVMIGGKKGAKPTAFIVDTATLKDVAVFTGEADPEGYGWNGGKFSPDSKLYHMTDGKGTTRIWDVRSMKLLRSFESVNKQVGRWQGFSPDGKWLALAWMPKWPEEVVDAQEPDPADLPQPRVTLYPVADAKAKSVTLIGPPGYVGSLAWRQDGKQLAFGSAGGVHLFDVSKLGE
jgi:WD40 repeat protein